MRRAVSYFKLLCETIVNTVLIPTGIVKKQTSSKYPVSITLNVLKTRVNS
jgi:hypothetical protein